tara:strand:+ start:56 stop:673 length:618 start_codon:yes stop_codon:yes gene_type:complete
MPVFDIKKTKNYVYAIWQIEEDVDMLLNTLKVTKEELKEINKISHLNRKKQNITARILLNKLARNKTKLKYRKNGQPHCSFFKHISISHSKDLCSVIISENLIGIDVQYLKQSIQKLYQKFINEEDIKYWGNSISLAELHLIWCAKEAIYKTLNNTSCSLKNNIYVINDKKAYYEDEKTRILYKIDFRTIKNYFIAIATKSEDYA